MYLYFGQLVALEKSTAHSWKSDNSVYTGTLTSCWESLSKHGLLSFVRGRKTEIRWFMVALGELIFSSVVVALKM